MNRVVTAPQVNLDDCTAEIETICSLCLAKSTSILCQQNVCLNSTVTNVELTLKPIVGHLSFLNHLDKLLLSKMHNLQELKKFKLYDQNKETRAKGCKFLYVNGNVYLSDVNRFVYKCVILQLINIKLSTNVQVHFTTLQSDNFVQVA